MITRLLWSVMLAGRVVWGCSCADGPPPACQAINYAKAVFVGTAIGYETGEPRTEQHPAYRWVKFQVIEWFRGSGEREIRVATGFGGGDCGIEFQPGRVYLVYAGYSNVLRGLGTGICTRTAAISHAQDDLAYLRSLAKKGPEGRIFGYVTTQSFSLYEPYLGQGAVARVAVWAQTDAGTRKVLTNAKGEYEFNGLAPGRYRLRVDLPGKLGARSVRDVVLSPQGCAWERFTAKSRETGSISGVIRNAQGRPVPNVPVCVVDKQDGRVLIDSEVYTDREGRYQLRHIREGDYYVGINLRRPPQPATSKYTGAPYPTSYYPGVKERTRSRPVTVDAEKPAEHVDWRIGEAMATRTIRGSVVGPDGKPVSAWIALRADGYPHMSDARQASNDGTFTTDGVAGVAYRIQGYFWPRPPAQSWHSHTIPVPENGVLTIRLDQPGRSCKQCQGK